MLVLLAFFCLVASRTHVHREYLAIAAVRRHFGAMFSRILYKQFSFTSPDGDSLAFLSTLIISETPRFPNLFTLDSLFAFLRIIILRSWALLQGTSPVSVRNGIRLCIVSISTLKINLSAVIFRSHHTYPMLNHDSSD